MEKKRRMKSWRGTRWKSYLWKRKKKEIKIRKIKRRRSWCWRWKRSSKNKRGKGQEIIRKERVAVPTATQIISSRCFFSDFPRLPNSRELLPRISKPFWVYPRGDTVAKTPNWVDYIDGQYPVTGYQREIHTSGVALPRPATSAPTISRPAGTSNKNKLMSSII